LGALCFATVIAFYHVTRAAELKVECGRNAGGGGGGMGREELASSVSAGLAHTAHQGFFLFRVFPPRPPFLLLYFNIFSPGDLSGDEET